MIVTLVLMNLLIGILSESVSELYANKKRNDYFQLTKSLIDVESLIFYRQCSKEYKPKFLIYAQYEDLERFDDIDGTETGRITKLTNMMEKIAANQKEMATEVKEIATKQKGMATKVEDVATKVKDGDTK